MYTAVAMARCALAVLKGSMHVGAAVFCLEINVNGQRRVIAGGPAA
jgi:hypothetical protein